MKNLHQYQNEFNIKFDFTPDNMTKDKLEFRMGLAEEEVNEMWEAFGNKNPEDLLDSLIDQIYIAYGTLNMLGIDIDNAFFNVHFANMRKVKGIKTERIITLKDSYDVIKPLGWVAPDHNGHTGILEKLLETK